MSSMLNTSSSLAMSYTNSVPLNAVMSSAVIQPQTAMTSPQDRQSEYVTYNSMEYDNLEVAIGMLTTTAAANSSNATDVSALPPLPSVTFVVLSTIALGVMVLLVICGNVLVLLAVALERSLRNVTHYFIVNLAVADLLLGTTVLPFSATYEIIPYWPFGPTFCDIWAAVDVLCCTASINSLCVISIDRYIGVTRPLQHNMIMTKRRAGLIIAMVWLFSVSISAGPLFGWREPTKDPHNCPITDSLSYVIFSVAGSFYIPLIIILILYYRIYREAIIQTKFLMHGEKTGKGKNDVTLRVHTGQQRKASPRQGSTASGSPIMKGKQKASVPSGLGSKLARFNKEKKAAKTLGIVVGVFIVCWLPFFLLLPLTSICGAPCTPPDLVFKVAFWLGYFNSCLNPIIYAVSNRFFMRAFKRILTCRFGNKKKRYNRNRYVRTSGKQLIKYQNSMNGTQSPFSSTNRRYRRGNMSIASTSGYELTEISVTAATPSPSPSSANSRSIEGLNEEYQMMTKIAEEVKRNGINSAVDQGEKIGDVNEVTADENFNSETDKLLIDTALNSVDDSENVVETLTGTCVEDGTKGNADVNGNDNGNPSHLSKVSETATSVEDEKQQVFDEVGVCSKCNRRFSATVGKDPTEAISLLKSCASENSLQRRDEKLFTKAPSSGSDVIKSDPPSHSSGTWERLSSPESETVDSTTDDCGISRSRESVFSLQIIEEGDVPLTIPSRHDLLNRNRLRSRRGHMKETKLTNAGIQTSDSLLSLDFLQECLQKRTKEKGVDSGGKEGPEIYETGC
ncbi:alpha-1B adrenergic receptor-like [Ptychodera flava]|uniref:alpha-1B adrenergic receptor-like n=1 Tax=Ptychodera flava TaxID=63121 RepID=UPI003969F090